MFKDVLDYQWQRYKLLNAVVELWAENADSVLDDPVFKLAEDLSHRLSEIVAIEQFDKMRANIMLAREVAYWREWLDTQVANTDKNDEPEQAKFHKTAFADKLLFLIPLLRKTRIARRACNLSSEHGANRIAVKLFCRASAARATARRWRLGVGRIVPSSAAVRGSGMPRGHPIRAVPMLASPCSYAPVRVTCAVRAAEACTIWTRIPATTLHNPARL